MTAQSSLYERVTFDSPPGTKAALDRLAEAYKVGRADVLREAIVNLFEKEAADFPDDLLRVRPDLPLLRITRDAEAEEYTAFLVRENERLRAELEGAR